MVDTSLSIGLKSSINCGLNGCNGLSLITSNSTISICTEGLSSENKMVSSIRGLNHYLTNGCSSSKREMPLIVHKWKSGRPTTMSNQYKPKRKINTYGQSRHQTTQRKPLDESNISTSKPRRRDLLEVACQSINEETRSGYDNPHATITQVQACS